MKHLIEVNGICVYAFHGCLDEEAKIGGHYKVDVILRTNFSEAATSDRLSDTIDYVQVTRIVKEEMALRSNLIEQVGHRIVLRLTAELPKLDALRVKVIKISPPINGDVENVAVILEEGIW